MIRGFRLRDAADLSRLRANELSLTELPICHPSRGIMLSAFRSKIPILGFRMRCYVMEETRKVSAAIQASIRSNRDEWQIDYLASTVPFLVDADRVYAQWHDLVEWVIWHAAAGMAKRLYARVPIDTIEAKVFMDQGFHAYSREYYFSLDEQPVVSESPALFLRPQDRNDSWAIQQLFYATTPSLFRQVDPMTSKQWQLPSYFPNRQSRAYGFVAEDKDGMVAYLRCEKVTGCWMMRIIFRPEGRDMLAGAIGTVLAELEISKRSPMYIRLWDHQVDLRSLIEGLGADYLGTQTLLVRHMLGVVKVVDKQRLPALARVGRAAHSSGAGPGGR